MLTRLFKLTIQVLSVIGLGLTYQLSLSAQSSDNQLPTRTLPAIVSHAQPTASVDPAQTQDITFVLPLRNNENLQQTLTHLYTPGDPQFGHYLSSSEFAQKYGPDHSSIELVAGYAASQGLNVLDISANGTMIHVRGTSAAISHAFGVRILKWKSASGMQFQSADREPVLPAQIASSVLAISGLDNIARERPHSTLKANVAPTAHMKPNLSGTGHGFLSPNDVRSIYGLNGVPFTGGGQTLAIVALDTYNPRDISTFAATYGGSGVAIENVSVDNFNTAIPPGDEAAETVLDIDMLLALAPSASRILVYENANTGLGTLDIYNKIATDNRAKVISTSWGTSEQYNSEGLRQAENNVFAQMAAQGQSFFASSGDGGAYDNQSPGSGTASLSVNDPASQPLVTGVGGTTLQDTSSIGYLSESAWFTPTDLDWGPFGTGGGGGVSHYWQIPSWQVGSFSTATNPQGSTTMRNVPDVSLFGNFDSGAYSIFFSDPSSGPSWYGYNGTSATAPLWAAFTADVNQARAGRGLQPIGFLNPVLYLIGGNATAYGRDFHDINDGTTNAFYRAVPGYDNATGLGSFIGAPLLNDLAGNPDPAARLASLTVSPNPDVITTPATITVGLTTSAPAGGALVSILMNGAAWSTITVPAGSTSASMPYQAPAAGTYNIGAICGGVSMTAPLTVIPVALSAFTISPGSVFLTNNITATVILNGPAPIGGGIRVPLNWNGAAWAVIAIPSGGTTGTLTLKPVSAGAITTSATFGGVTKTFALTVKPIAVVAVRLTPNPVLQTSPVMVFVALNAPAPANGANIALTWNRMPWGSITVPAGQTSASLSKTPLTSGAITVAATLGSGSVSAALTVTPIRLRALSLSPPTVLLLNPYTVKVTLTAPAPAGGARVPVTKNGAALVTIVVPAGQTAAAATLKATTIGTFTIKATYNGGAAATMLTVK